MLTLGFPTTVFRRAEARMGTPERGVEMQGFRALRVVGGRRWETASLLKRDKTRRVVEGQASAARVVQRMVEVRPSR